MEGIIISIFCFLGEYLLSTLFIDLYLLFSEITLCDFILDILFFNFSGLYFLSESSLLSHIMLGEFNITLFAKIFSVAELKNILNRVQLIPLTTNLNRLLCLKEFVLPLGILGFDK